MKKLHHYDEEKSLQVVLPPPKWTWYPLRRRYLVAILGFFGCVHAVFLRINLSFAVVAMTQNYSIMDENSTITYQQDFEWDSKERGLILGSFFWGYITTQIIGGILAPMIGAGRLIGLGIFGTSLLTLLTPLVARMAGLVPLVVLRFLEGVVGGVVFPALSELMSFWAPPLERSIMMSIVYSGVHIGTFITMSLCGLISQYLGWEWIFYIPGATGVIWCFLWTWKVYENPFKDPNITAEEKNYIISSIGKLERTKFKNVPWKAIFTSVPIWADIVSHTAANTGLYTMQTQFPIFLSDLSDWRLDKMGILAAVPYLVLGLASQVSGQLADFLRSRFKISTTTVRKVFTSGCYIVQMSFLLIAAYVTHSPVLLIASLTIAVASGGFSACNVNNLDLAPQFAGITFALSNTMATLPGMISPYITGYIVQNKLASEWMNVFYVTAGVFLFGAIFYALFGSGERQPWALDEKTDDEKDELQRKFKDTNELWKKLHMPE